MQREVEALQQLARAAVQGPAAKDTLAAAASIIRRATGATEAMVVYAPGKEFLTCSDAGDGPATELTLAALTRVQRQAAQANGPAAFNLVGHRVEDFTSGLSDGEREFLAFSVPTTESAAEMCILRGAWQRKGRARILRFMESATPALTVILERFLNADRSRRLAEQLQTLANAAQMLTRSEDVKVALRDLATAISASTDFEYLVNIDMYDATTNRFFLRIMSEQRHTTGTLAQIWEASLNPDRPDPWDVEVMTTLQPAFRPDMQNDPVYPEHVRKFFARALLRSTADFPLLFQNEFLGMMAFVSYKPRTFPPDEVNLLQGFAAQVATAIKALQMHKELQRYAQDIKRSADQYIATTNLTGDLMARLDRRGNWTFLNDAACQFYGKPREELLGTDSSAYVHPDDLETTVQAIRQVRANKKPLGGFGNRQVTPMGTRVVEWNGYPLFDEEGQYTGIQITGRDVTERKQTEETLRESETRYRLLADNATDIIWTRDMNLRLTYTSPSVTSMLGYSVEEAMAQTMEEVLTPASLEVAMKAVAEQLAIENMEQKDLFRSRTLEVEQYCKDGSTVWLEVTMTFLRDEDNRPVGILGVSREITKRKRAEEALRESEARYKTLFAGAPVGMLVADLETKQFRYSNPVACRMFGYTEEEFLRIGVAAIHPKESLDHVLAEFEAQVRGEKLLAPGLPCLRKDGTLFYADISGIAIVLDGRKCNVGIFTDITERKRAEEALRESEARYKALFAGAPVGMLVADRQTGQFRYANPAVCRMFGYTEEEFLRIGVAAISPKESLDQVLVEFEAQMRGEKLLSPGIPCLRKDGTLFYADISGIAIVLDGRKCSVGIFSDITERKRTEDELRETRDYLEKLIDHANAPIIVWDPSFTITRFNDAFERLTGRPANQVIGQRLEVLFPEHERAASMEQIARTLGGEFWELIEIPILHQSGEVRQVLWNSANITGADGRTVVATIAQGADITERRQMEEALRENERLYRLITENTADVVWTQDMSLRYTYVSPAITRMRGYTVEEVVGLSIRDTMTPASLEAATKTLAEQVALEGVEGVDPNRATKIELEMYCKDGSTIWTEMNMTFMRDSNGRPVGILGITRNISERKRAEEERDRLHAELEVRAITDGLTGLYNHAHFFQRLAEETERSKRYNHGFAVVMMDVNNFKLFNDSCGHQAGDEALRLIADCIRSGLRRSDIAFRYGGDEFAAILPHADFARAWAVVSRINRCITKSLKQADGETAARLSLSAGVAHFPDDGSTADELVAIADAALYSAKWAAHARGVMEEGYATESPATPAEALRKMQTEMLSSAASSLTAALRELGVPDVLAELNMRTIAALGTSAEIKDPYVRGHQERASGWAATLAEEMGLSSDRVRAARFAALLHDLGKAGISKSILNKPGKLTEEEFAKIKQHPPLGSMMIASEVEALQQLVPIVRHHHERFDGKGYPDGLAGEEIPLEARILAVVDSFDAMIHDRVYRKALRWEDAIAELQRCAGTQFDPAVVEAFLALVKGQGEETAASTHATSETPQLAAVRTPKTK